MPTLFTSPATLSGLPPETPLLVAFSGGADSRLLLELTVDWARANGAPVTAAHLHHGIRGAEADRDEAFCRGVAAAHGIAYVCERADIPARAARSGRSLELEARLARYAFFSRVMQARGIPLLLTAHHADDQLETLLLRLLRGSGTHGLAGIPPVRPVPGGLLLRPLLTATRQDILDACRARGLTYVTDSTNLTDDCTRNCLRHRVVPLLEETAGSGIPQRTAARLCAAVREDDSFLCAEAERVFPTADDRGDGTLSVAALRAMHPALAKRCMARAFTAHVCAAQVNETQGGAGDAVPADRSPEYVHMQALTAIVAAGREGSAVSLPGGWRGTVRAARLVFLPPDGTPQGGAPQDGTPQSAKGGRIPAETPDGVQLVPGDTRWCAGGLSFTVRLESAEQPLRPDTGADVVASAVFPPDLPQPLALRRRRPGDTVLSHGMTRKLKKILCEKQVPPALRDALPLVCLPGNTPDAPPCPLWFPTAVFRDGWKPPTAGACLRLTVRAAEPSESDSEQERLTTP